MKHKIITNYKAFTDLRREWNILLSKSKANTIFLTWEWLDSWWQAYRTTEELHIITILDDSNELIGIAPMVINRISSGLFMDINALYFMGIRPDQKLTEYMDLIAKSGCEDDICHEFLRIINRKKVGWDILLINEVPEYSSTLNSLKKHLSHKRFLFSEASHGCSVIMLPDDYEDYLKSLKPRIRTKLRSLPRRLNEKHNVELEICTGGDKLPATMKSFFDLHQRRWESKDQLGTFKDECKVEFYNILTKYFISQKWLRIYSLKVDGQFRAHEYCFLYNNNLFVLQEGFDPDWLNQGVGNILRTLVIRDCIDNGVEVYDFLGGVTFHKNKWGVHIKNSITYSFGRKKLGTYTYFYLPVIIDKTKEAYRAIIPKKLVQWRIDLYNKCKAMKVRRAIASEKE